MEKVSAVVIDADPKKRAMLKSAVMAVADYRNVYQARSIFDCLRLLEDKEKDLLVNFISYDFAKEEIGRLVAQGKSTSAGADSAYIVVLDSKDQNSGAVTKSLLDGVDGFLLAPFSVDSLVELTHLARTIKRQRKQSRLENIVKFMIGDALKTIDAIARKKINDEPPGELIKTFKQLGESIKHLDVNMTLYYFNSVINQTGEASPFPARSPSKVKQEAKTKLNGAIAPPPEPSGKKSELTAEERAANAEERIRKRLEGL